MTHVRAVLVRALLITTALLAAPRLTSGADAVPDLAKFETQRQERLAALDFACDYVYKAARFEKEKDAREKSLDDAPEIATGFVAKRGENYRFTAAHEFREQGDYVVSAGVDCDRAANDALDAAFFPPTPNQNGAESLGFLKPNLRGDVLAVLPELDLESPAALELRPLDALPTQYGGVKLPLRSAEKVGDDRVRFTFVGDSPRGRCVKTVLVRVLSASSSAVEEIETRFYNTSGTAVGFGVLEIAGDWRDAQGVPLPARVRRATYETSGGSARFFVVEWSSRNLGKRRASKFDFMINIKDGEDVEDPTNDPENGLVDLSVATSKDVARESILFRDGKRASK